MADTKRLASNASRWAELRYGVIGPLLADPPEQGDLSRALERLATKRWKHPVTGERTRFGFSTLERWYYRAKRNTEDPIGALRRESRCDPRPLPSAQAHHHPLRAMGSPSAFFCLSSG